MAVVPSSSHGGGLGNVTLSGTPSAGQVPTATGATAATWQAPAAGWPPKSFVIPAAGILPHSGGTALGLNTIYGFRVVVPATGTLAGLACNITASSGNYDIGVYDTSATTRNRLYSKGSTASPGTGWRELGTPALAVNAGDHVDICVVTDNNTFAIDFCLGGGSAGFGTMPANYLVSPLGGAAKLWWFASVTFPLPSTIAESSLAVTNQSIPIIVGRIT